LAKTMRKSSSVCDVLCIVTHDALIPYIG